MSKILIDTNVLIYSIDEDSKYFNRAQNLVLNSVDELFTTSKNLSEFLTVVTKFPKKTLSVSEALKIVEDFSNILTILYPTALSFKLFLNLLKKYNPIGLKIHDLEIVSIALSNDIDMVATFNIKDFRNIKEIDLYRKL